MADVVDIPGSEVSIGDASSAIVDGLARKMVQVHVDAALVARRHALHRLRMGDRADHLIIMKLTRLPLLQARAWKAKP
jgi:hypothetical protein